MKKTRAPFYIRCLSIILLLISFSLSLLVYRNISSNSLAVEVKKPSRVTTTKTPIAQQPAAPTQHSKQTEQKPIIKPHHTPVFEKSTSVITMANTSSKPKIAIIIDDLGYSEKIGKDFISLPYPISFAFIPFSPYAQALAHQAHKENKLVMLHIPMATMNNGHKWEDSLHPDMDDNAIVSMLSRMLENIPHVIGANNHGGSLFTQSENKMRIVFDQLKSKQLFFIDSRTSSQTVGHQLAKKMDIPFNQRDVFLDNMKNKNDIHLQVDKLIATAKQQGYAIGIAHPYVETYDVLTQRLGNLKEVELVSADLLTKRHKYE